MGILLSFQELAKAYTDRPLFRGLTFGLAEGQRVGLVGPNGAGKSTLLKILAGLEKPDAGTVSSRRGVRLGYVPQQDDLPEDRSIRQVLEDALAGDTLDEHEQAARVDTMLARAGFREAALAVSTLSGGWRKRLALAAALIRQPDLLLLDEPTNHLDLEGILWLEAQLRGAAFAFLLVSHDRYLLDRVTNRMVELNRVYAEGYLSVEGKYGDLLARREGYLEAQANEQAALANKVRREVEWLGRTAEARSTKSSFRIKEAGRLMEDLAEVRYRNAQTRTADIDFTASRRKTVRLLVAEGVEKGLGGRSLLAGLNLVLSPGMRLGLLGPNGSGKTTLLRLLAGELAPDRGTIKPAEGLRIVYFDQNREQLERGTPLRHALSPTGETVQYRGSAMHIVAWAKRFLFRPDQLELPVGLLSGGEQARVLIARLMLRPADLLILDEPTNDLDIPTLEVLEETLADFPGALVLVTHDRALLDRVSTELLALDGRGGARPFADYTQWEQARLATTTTAPVPTRGAPERPPTPVAALSRPELRELGRMEEKIEAAEGEVATLEARLARPEVAADHVRLQACWAEIQMAREKVAALYTRWEDLEAKKATP